MAGADAGVEVGDDLAGAVDPAGTGGGEVLVDELGKVLKATSGALREFRRARARLDERQKTAAVAVCAKRRGRRGVARAAGLVFNRHFRPSCLERVTDVVTNFVSGTGGAFAERTVTPAPACAGMDGEGWGTAALRRHEGNTFCLHQRV